MKTTTTLRLREALLVAVGAGALAVAAGAAGCGSDTGSSQTGGGDGGSSDAAASSDAQTSDHAVADSATGDDSSVIGDGASDAPADAPATVRRPFLVGASLRAARATARRDWARTHAGKTGVDVMVDDATARALARAWLADALEEHASVAAFARFTLQLLSVGAPPELVALSQRASLDEIEHARGCFELARRYGAGEQGPAALRVDDAIAPATLADVAALTAEEGCVGETLGALLAREQLAVVGDERAARFLERLARDEERHAALAWRFLAWAVGAGGEPVRARAREAIERACAATLRMEIRPLADGVDPATWRAHGRLSCAEARAVAARGIAEVVEPCARAALG